jgi:hypothetical protein
MKKGGPILSSSPLSSLGPILCGFGREKKTPEAMRVVAGRALTTVFRDFFKKNEIFHLTTLLWRPWAWRDGFQSPC